MAGLMVERRGIEFFRIPLFLLSNSFTPTFGTPSYTPSRHIPADGREWTFGT